MTYPSRDGLHHHELPLDPEVLVDERRLHLVPAHVALADLWALNFRLQTDDGRARSFRQLTRLTSAVPAWNLHRPLRLAMLERTVARLLEQFDRDRG